ncbi:MAG: hypothetical protein WD397_01200 [Wenzhouxiangellaceae bacterium]
MNNETNWRVIALQVLILLAVAFGVVAWIQRPEGALVWLVGMLTMPLAWGLLVLFGAMPPHEQPQQRRTVFNSLLGAGLMIAGALGACALGTLGAISEDWISRFGMIATALVLVVIGNGLPKKSSTGCRTSRSTAVKRLMGWTFVLGGLALTVTWLLVPSVDEALGVITAGIYIAMGMVIVVGLQRIRLNSKSGDPTG